MPKIIMKKSLFWNSYIYLVSSRLTKLQYLSQVFTKLANSNSILWTLPQVSWSSTLIPLLRSIQTLFVPNPISLAIWWIFYFIASLIPQWLFSTKGSWQPQTPPTTTLLYHGLDNTIASTQSQHDGSFHGTPLSQHQMGINNPLYLNVSRL